MSTPRTTPLPPPTFISIAFIKIVPRANVTFSAGGGGNTESRKSKIYAKNEKLAEERERDRIKREEIESKQAERAAKKEARGIKNKKSKGGDAAGDAKEGGDAAGEEDASGGIHPARLAMMNAPTPKFQRTQRPRF